MKFLVQVNGTDNDKWLSIAATNREAAVLVALRKAEKPSELIPCTVYVSIGSMRHDNGAPMAVESFKVTKPA